MTISCQYFKDRQLGNFGIFPEEVRGKILAYLPASDLHDMIHSISSLRILGRPLLGQKCYFDGIEEGIFARWFDCSGQSLSRLKLIHLPTALNINFWIRLENLKLYDTIQGSFPFSQLALCTRVKQLDISQTNPQKDDLKFISKLTSLHSLDLTGNVLSHETLHDLRNSTLTRLAVNGRAIADLNFLNQLPNLLALNIAAGSLTGGFEREDYITLAKFTNLTSLSIVNANVSEEGLICLARLTNLTLLNLQNCYKLTNGLKSLTNLINLT